MEKEVSKIILGPEISLYMISNKQDKKKIIEFIHELDGSAIDIIEAVESKYDCSFQSEIIEHDIFNWKQEKIL
jgi:hypothetical protein